LYETMDVMRIIAIDWNAVAAVSTALAVAVALLLPFYLERWRVRRTEPRLVLWGGPEDQQLYKGKEAEPVEVNLYNRPGRHRADSVEVVVTAEVRLGEELRLAGGLRQARIRASDGYVTSVAPGFSRRAYLAQLTSPGAEASFGVECGYWEDETHTPLISGIWDVEVTVTGANFNALAYSGQMRVQVHDDREDDRFPVTLKWISPLSPTDRKTIG
jgi:hypothetical protein